MSCLAALRFIFVPFTGAKNPVATTDDDTHTQQLQGLVDAEEQKDSQCSDSAKAGDDEEQRRKDHSDAVNDRLRNFAAFEQRYGRKARGSG